jgi:hypothetical protein
MAYAVINGEKTAAPEGAIAYKYADPTEDARWISDESEAESIANDDPSLIVEVVRSYDLDDYLIEE